MPRYPQRLIGASAWIAPILLAASLIGASAASATSPRSTRTACELSTRDSTWIALALDGWQRDSSRALHAPPIRFPTLVLFDSLCSHTLAPAQATVSAGFRR